MERWTFLIIAGDDGAAVQIRVRLRDGDDEAGWPEAQLAVDGTEVPVDRVAHDYEAPEWRALQLLGEGMGTAADSRLQQVKDQLRSRARARA